MKIHWNGFMKSVVDEYPREVCAFLFSRSPYSYDEEWFVFQVKNISEIPAEEWIPDKNEMHRVKAKAIKMGLTKIGNIHSHPFIEGYLIENVIGPSKKDLQFARRFNDIIRGILVVSKEAIYGIRFHDKFGNQIPITVVSKGR